MCTLHTRVLAAALLFASASACSAQRPTVYPNDQYQRAGAAGAERDVADCEARARQFIESGGRSEQMAGEAARNVGVGAAVGGATGAVGGAIGGNAGQGAAVGAASGATAGLLGTMFGWMFRASEPDPVYRNFVDRCLRDKGYEPIGWK